MTSYLNAIGRSRIAAVAMIGTIVAFGAVYKAKAHEGPEHLVFSTQLPNVPGKSLTAVVVSYEPGGKSPAHHHAGSVFAFVLSGEIRSQNSATGPAKIYKAGEAFFEPPGSTHSISENASTTEPASLLAIFVADDGAKLTTFDQ
jgi:quercetin dioxygenase-like cupin family protein